MIHELRMYTLKPGSINKALEASGTVAKRIRGSDNYGKLEGHWSSEIGTLNQYIHLWGFESVSEMQRLRGELAALPEWRKEYVPLIRPNILRQEIRILRPVLDMKDPEGDNNFHELRTYRVKPGKAAEWTGRMVEAMPAREKYSRNLGLWINDFPDPNEITHLWAYKSWQERMEARAGSQADPVWKKFLGYAGPLIEDMHSMILTPSPYSPRQ